MLTKDELERYSRHLTLPEFGYKKQELLKQSSVLVVGSGGLGSPTLLYLAAAGVGVIGVVDFDIVEKSNLQRQVIHSSDWIGKPKALSAQYVLNNLNKNCNIRIYNETLTAENALQIIKEYDVVVDGTDNFPTRYLVNDACVLLDKPYIYGSILRFEGQASVFNLNRNSPNYRDLVPEPPPKDLVPSCAEGGVLGVLPGIIGVIQATETIKVLTGIGETLDGRLLVYDALQMKFKELKIQKTNEYKIEKLINYNEFCNPADLNNKASEIFIQDIEPVLAKELLSSGEYVIIDVRTENERQICKIDGSLHFEMKNIENGRSTEAIRKISKNKKIIMSCKIGGRSRKCAEILAAKNIVTENLKGGILKWIDEVAPELAKY